MKWPPGPASLGLCAALLAAPSGAYAGPCSPGTAVLTTPDGRPLRISVEVADDPAERAQGLMGRASLGAAQGMLFVYESPRPVSFWMKNTIVALDMLFFDGRGVLRHVRQDARPYDLTPIPGAPAGDPDPDRLLVLELPAGAIAADGLVPGTTLTHPAVPQKNAAAPCD